MFLALLAPMASMAGARAVWVATDWEVAKRHGFIRGYLGYPLIPEGEPLSLCRGGLGSDRLTDWEVAVTTS